MKRTTFLSLAAALLLPLAVSAQPTVDFVLTNGIIEPHSIAFAGESKFFITDAATHRVLSFDSDNGLLSVFAGAGGQSGSANGPGFLARFISPKGIVAARGGLVVADSGNHTLRFLTTTGSVSVVSTFAGTVGQPGLVDGPANAARFNNPVGLAADTAGNIYVADAKNNAVRKIDPNNNVVTLSTAFSEPNGVALDENGRIFVADTRNNAIKLIESGSIVSLLAGSASKVAGTNDSYFASEALFNAPNALLWVGGGTGLLVSDTGSHTVRRVYYNDVVASFFPQLNGYSVETYAGTPNQPGFVDGAVLSAKFNTPIGLARNTEGGLVLADLGNRALRHIQTTPRLPKVKNPVVGFVTFFYDTFSGRYVSSLTGFTNIVFNNDALIQIRAEPNTETFYTVGPTPNLFEADTIAAPNSQNSLSAPFYQDGMGTDEVKPSIISPSPDITLKIISSSDGRRPSDVLRARAQFKASAPNILGDNPASFAVSCDTTNAAIWYTLDGSTPTNQAPSIEAVTGSISIITDTSFVFRARAFRNNYKPSEITTKSFSASEFQANRISFGFHHGEASSDFLASPGQRFYAPVTLSVLPQAKMYSLQFNVLVTNLASAPAVTPGAVGFQSTLREEIPVGSRKFRVIPPAMFITSSDPPPAGSTILHGGVPFQSLLVTNSTLNLIGVGWLERGGTDKTNLFNTIAQDLITYSQPHDTLFLKTGSKVVVGAYSFVVPTTAGPGDAYQITLGRASATSDGIGGPGGDVYVDIPTNGSLGSGSINSIKNVVVGQRRYTVGDVAPFRWFNAGDFGNTNLYSDDVLQVFQSAIYSINEPIPGSDFADAMDSCCADFAAVPGASHVVHGPNTFTGSAENPFFDGNDASINNIAFGDGTLDVTDVYVTFRRALDPSLTWYERFWTNGVLAAQAVPNLFRGKPNLPAEEYTNAGSLADTDLSATESPSASFTAPDLIVTGGQTLSVPITAQITGRYAAHICMLNLELEPLDGSPDLMEAVEFLPNPSLGQPTLSSSHGIGNYGAAWLERGIMGLKGRTQIGMLRVKLPPNLPPNAAYRLRFEHVSASPNGLAAFPKNAQDGLLLASARNDSSFNDGIPDTWRLRHFGSTANLLSHANADADGDGVPNWAEFKAGTNPVDGRSNIRMNAQHRPPNNRGVVLRWPTAKGKTYAIEAALSVTSRVWTPIAPNVTGTGFEMEFAPKDDGITEQFYRVRLVE